MEEGAEAPSERESKRWWVIRGHRYEKPQWRRAQKRPRSSVPSPHSPSAYDRRAAMEEGAEAPSEGFPAIVVNFHRRGSLAAMEEGAEAPSESG